MRILMWTPTYGGGLRAETVASIEAQKHTQELVWFVDHEQKYKAPDHRNVVLSYRRGQKRALAEGFDAMLTLEHDMVLPHHAVEELATTPGDVVYGVYLFRWGDYVLNTFEYINDKNIGESLSLWPDKAKAALKKGVVRVSGGGWGCTLVKRKALERIELPESWPENPAFDIAFAQQALRAKLRMNANFRVLCGHLKDNELLLPFGEDSAIDYNGAAVMLGGQLMPMYRRGSSHFLRVRPVAKLNCLVDGSSMRLEKGKVYELPYHVASELVRAALVEAVN